MSKRAALEEEIATQIGNVRADPTCIIGELERLANAFIGVTPICNLTAKRRLRLAEGKGAVEAAIQFCKDKLPEKATTYSYGMSEASRAKFSTPVPPLTDRLATRGQWSGTCADFVQMGVEELPAITVVALMIISSGDPKRQIRDRLFAADKERVGVAIGKYKSQTAVSITLATQFLENAPTQQEEAALKVDEEVPEVVQDNVADAQANVDRLMAQANRGANPDDSSEDEEEKAIQAERLRAIQEMQANKHIKGEPEYASDEEERQVQEERMAALAALEGKKTPRATEGKSGVVSYDSDEEMAAMQRERMAKLAALERGYHAPEQSVPEDNEVSMAGASAPRHTQPDAVTENWKEKRDREARERAAEEEKRRANIEAAQAAVKNNWKAERAAREAAKKKKEQERLARLQEEHERAQSRSFGGGGNRAAPGLSLRQTAPAATRSEPKKEESNSALDNAFKSSETDPHKREEERLMRAMTKKSPRSTGGGIFGGGAKKVSPRAAAPAGGGGGIFGGPKRLPPTGRGRGRGSAPAAAAAAAPVVDKAAEEEARKKREQEQRAAKEQQEERERKQREQQAAADAATAAGGGGAQDDDDEPLPTFGASAVPKAKGNIELAFDSLSNIDAGGVRLYLNALIRPEESIVIQTLDDVRADVTFYSESAHQVVRRDKYTVVLDPAGEAREIRLPPAQLLDGDFNHVTDFFCFGTADYIELFKDEQMTDGLQMEKLSEITPDTVYYVKSGNTFQLKSGDPPTLWLADRQIDLPEESLEGL